MKLIKAALGWLVLIIKIIAYGWIVALIFLIKQIWILILRCLGRHKMPERERKVSDDDCVTVKRGTVSHPDPLIYSQWELMNLGLAVTWDNPDVQLFHAGAPVSSWELQPATEYEVVARVWNKSTEAPVVGLPVRFFALSFGVGATLEPIGSTSIPVLGVKGGPNHPAFAKINWKTPAVPGHYCLQVLLQPTDDENFGNNAGAENTLVGVAQSPADFTFELRNNTRRRQTYRFEVDTYQIPGRLPCDEHPDPDPDPAEDTRRPQPKMPEPAMEHVPAEHDRRNYPVPSEWSVDVVPAEASLEPDESLPVRVQITPPAGFVGRKAFNVNGFNDLGFAGGVTLYVDAS